MTMYYPVIADLRDDGAASAFQDRSQGIQAITSKFQQRAELKTWSMLKIRGINLLLPSCTEAWYDHGRTKRSRMKRDGQL